MDIEEAKRITKLYTREFPEARFEFMRRQLGEVKIVPTRIGTFKTVNESIFHLKYFGETWERAVAMWRVKGKPQVKNPNDT